MELSVKIGRENSVRPGADDLTVNKSGYWEINEMDNRKGV